MIWILAAAHWKRDGVMIEQPSEIARLNNLHQQQYGRDKQDGDRIRDADLRLSKWVPQGSARGVGAYTRGHATIPGFIRTITMFRRCPF